MAEAWRPGRTKTPPGVRDIQRHKSMIGTLMFWHFVGIASRYPPLESENIPGFAIEEGDTVALSLRFATNRALYMDLSKLTEEELDLLKEFLVKTIEEARPVVQARDTAARKAEDRGDYNHHRSYRATPKLSWRKGQVGQHSTSVRDGREDVLSGDEAGADSTGEPEPGGSRLAQQIQATEGNLDSGESTGPDGSEDSTTSHH